MWGASPYRGRSEQATRRHHPRTTCKVLPTTVDQHEPHLSAFCPQNPPPLHRIFIHTPNANNNANKSNNHTEPAVRVRRRHHHGDTGGRIDRERGMVHDDWPGPHHDHRHQRRRPSAAGRCGALHPWPLEEEVGRCLVGDNTEAAQQKLEG